MLVYIFLSLYFIWCLKTASEIVFLVLVDLWKYISVKSVNLGDRGGGYTNEPFDPIINVSVQYFFVFYTGGMVYAGSMSKKYIKSLLDFF